MELLTVELGVPYTGWPVRLGDDYQFAYELVDEDLREELIDWAWHLSNHLDENGWSSPESESKHESWGQALQRRLQDALGPGYQVQLIPAVH